MQAYELTGKKISVRSEVVLDGSDDRIGICRNKLDSGRDEVAPGRVDDCLSVTRLRAGGVGIVIACDEIARSGGLELGHAVCQDLRLAEQVGLGRRRIWTIGGQCRAGIVGAAVQHIERVGVRVAVDRGQVGADLRCRSGQ